MQVPSPSAFSPLPELISQFGLPNPLEVLPLLQNELEQVDVAVADWQAIATELETLADELESSSTTIVWTSAGAENFRTTVGEVATSLRGASAKITNCAQQQDGLKVSVLDVIHWTLIALATLAGFLAVTFAVAMAASWWSFGSSLLVWLSLALGVSLEMVIAITGALALLLGTAGTVLGVVKGEIEQANSDVPCTAP